MDVMPQQDPESGRPPEPSPQDPYVMPAEGATAVPPPPPTLRTTLRRAAFGAVAAGVLLAGALVAVDDGEGDGPKEPGPVERAEAATTAGSPASLSDLTALIGDRQKWVESHPRDAPSLATLGTAYVEWARRSADTAYYARAEETLKRSLEARAGERGNGEAWVGLAALANARHDFLAAKRWGETVKRQQPKAWSVYPVLIDAYTGLGDQKAATAATEKFGELRKGVPALARTAELYRGQGWREDALATAREAADRATQPAEKAEALHRLGELAWERGEPEEAVAQFDAALRTDAGQHASLAGRARALVALERTDEALAAYQSALEKLPRPEYALELGELYESLGLDGDARTQYTALREMVAGAKRAGVDESLLLARFEADHGDPDEAVELLRGQWREQHRSAAVADALGWALHRAGKSQEGLEYAERAVGTGVRNASYAYHLGMIQRELEDYGPARRNLEQAVRTNPAFSPLAAPLARQALEALGEPPPGGPGDMQPPPPPAPEPKPEPKREAERETESGAGRKTKPEAPAAPSKSPAPAPAASKEAAAGSAAPAEGGASKSP
ncbi:tetratricopeptide repeat protein [Streptomyces anulatus]|uniref:tetratricopeptide repeat protein n=2 Tax=Streptomyces TaxID=1883 RepID=UPI00225B354F|nr:tetratricopeptide repeat protein [Streptomyces anulatus]MCX4484953.1 tetratricopeptide repeat protein [Streptomyces anulatus]MCX4518602.1 tetratricopeptide repeat protein [Streptomyces anulatus]WSU73875.1 tetratricopeptide repeat protein [Streptomyces anulatus]WTD10135.1 tetratricopeptide repeat protein [Streptomyces anulatus]WTE03440.1 tetratricopeptide repeat protein [Streptomyces anulatus]